MENAERQLIERALNGSFELRRLYNQHTELEQKLKRLGRQAYLTVPEQLEEKKLKHLKLVGVERMLKIAAHENSVASNDDGTLDAA